MDSTINGEVSDESTDKDKASDLSAKESSETVQSNSMDDCLNNSAAVSEQTSVKKNTDNLSLNTSISEDSVPQMNSSAACLTVQSITNNTESNHSIDSDVNFKLSNASPKDVHTVENSIKSKENSIPEIQNDSACLPDVEKSDDINLSEQPHESQSSSKPFDSSLDLSISPPGIKSKSCEDPPQSSNLEEKMDTEGNNSSLETLSAETAEKNSSESDNKTSDVSENDNKTSDVSESDNKTSDVSESDNKTPDVSESDNKTPDVSESDSKTPDVSENDNKTSDVLEKDNKTSDVSLSKNSSNTGLCENLSEKILNSISNSLNTPPTATDKEPYNNITDLESVSADYNTAEIEKDTGKNESSPLEQLNEHLNSISCNAETSDCSELKTNAQDADVNKTHSPKEDQKSAASDDRLKQSDSFVFTEISKEETGFPEAFTGLVVIGKYISVKGDFTLKSSEALVESPSLIAPYLLKEPDTFPPRLNDSKLEQRDFFHSTAGEMLIGIGLSRVSEWFHRDMTRIKKRQMKKEGKNPELEEDLKVHENYYNEARKANKIYSFALKACKTCGFSTESSIVMEGHLLVPHINQKREYQCNFCEVFNRDPKAILEHMFRVHQKTGRIQPPTLFFECPYCSFESNSKVKLGNHFMKCQRFYDPNRNQAPPKDFEFPALTPKPITVAVVKSYEKSISSMQRGRGRPKKVDTLTEQLNMNQFSSNINHAPLISSQMPPYRPSSTSSISENLSSMTNQMISSLQMPNMGLRPHSNLGSLRPNLPPPMHLPSANRFFQVVNSSGPLMPMLSNSPLVTTPSQFPYNSSMLNTNSVSKKVPTHSPQFLNSLFGGSLRQQNPPKSVPEVTLTPLPKLHGPYPVPVTKPSNKPSNNSSSSSTSSLVVCEICDGYIKDLEQLRSHMQLIHKVKIHPKMLVSRPPLNCQKCQWRFFTDQGLERHLLGAHGLVTSNMQEQANKGKDAGCCTICGRVFASKLVSHMNQVHKLTLKPAHLSYKCTVCSATFNLYRLFENHVYLVHSGAAKRPSDGSSNSSKKLKSSGDYGDSHFEGGEPKNHSEKNAKEDVLSKCTDCGKDFKKHPLQTDKCAKCLKSDDVSQGTLSSMS